MYKDKQKKIGRQCFYKNLLSLLETFRIFATCVQLFKEYQKLR